MCVTDRCVHGILNFLCSVRCFYLTAWGRWLCVYQLQEVEQLYELWWKWKCQSNYCETKLKAPPFHKIYPPTLQLWVLYWCWIPALCITNYQIRMYFSSIRFFFFFTRLYLFRAMWRHPGWVATKSITRTHRCKTDSHSRSHLHLYCYQWIQNAWIFWLRRNQRTQSCI